MNEFAGVVRVYFLDPILSSEATSRDHMLLIVRSTLAFAIIIPTYKHSRHTFFLSLCVLVAAAHVAGFAR